MGLTPAETWGSDALQETPQKIESQRPLTNDEAPSSLPCSSDAEEKDKPKVRTVSRGVRLILIVALAALVLIIGLYLFNYARLQSKMDGVIKGDVRNKGISVSVHYGNYINTSKIIYTLDPLPTDKNSSDAFRVLWQFSRQVSLDSFSQDEFIFGNKGASNLLRKQITLQEIMKKTLADDPRNKGIEVFVYYSNLSDPAILFYDLQNVAGTNSMTDVFRGFLQFAENVQAQRFDRVELCFRGKPKFMIDGDYYQQLGKERSWQNPVYTIRTFPQNLKNLDGSPAYSTWTGGMIGVLQRQMEDSNDFHKKWYVEEVLKEMEIKK
jgi:hypothetical protein